MCGNCCTGPPGYVRFTREEGRRIAERLGVTHEQFIERYTQPTSAGRSFAEVETEHGFDCVFLDRASIPGKAICSLYEDRPTQCRTFPWWPEHMSSKNAWERLAGECEGVGRGDFIPADHITRELQRQRRSRFE